MNDTPKHDTPKRSTAAKSPAKTKPAAKTPIKPAGEKIGEGRGNLRARAAAFRRRRGTTAR